MTHYSSLITIPHHSSLFLAQQSKPAVSVHYFPSTKRSQISDEDACEILPHRSLADFAGFSIGQPKQNTFGDRRESLRNYQISCARSVGKRERQDEYDHRICARREPQAGEEPA